MRKHDISSYPKNKQIIFVSRFLQISSPLYDLDLHSFIAYLQLQDRSSDTIWYEPVFLSPKEMRQISLD